MRRALAVFFALLLSGSELLAAPAKPLGARAGQVAGQHGTTLSWAVSTTVCTPTSTPPCTIAYNVFRSTTAGGESLSTPVNAAPIAALTYFDPITLTGNPQTFFYVVATVETVTETSGTLTAQSGPSNEVSATFPGIPASPASLVGAVK